MNFELLPGRLQVRTELVFHWDLQQNISRNIVRVLLTPEQVETARYYANSKSGGVNKKQFQDELRLAKKYGQKYPLAIILHEINYWKITLLYQLLSLFNKK